jgi:hypothetical protein
MAQVFKPSSNTYARLSLVVVAVLANAVGFGLYRFNESFVVTRNFEARAQPVQFSHKHHNAELGIDCRYCHLSVEETSFAGIPPTQVCMNCHSQIWKDAPILEPVRASYRTGEPLEWVRVHDLADFAYFNHAAHLAKGVGCASCHGDMSQMNLTWSVAPLSMGWCLDCHRNPEKFVRPKDKIFDVAWVAEDQEALGARLVDEYHVQPRTDCSTCHR